MGSNTIKLRVTDTHAASTTGTGSITRLREGGTCSDGNGARTRGRLCLRSLRGNAEPPGELQNARFSSDKVTSLWGFDPQLPVLFRGAVSALPEGDELCFDNVGVSLLTDGTTPLPGEGTLDPHPGRDVVWCGRVHGRELPDAPDVDDLSLVTRERRR